MDKKNILMVLPHLPYPKKNGAMIRDFNIIKILSKRFNLFLISIIGSDREKKSVTKLKKYCKDIILVKIKKRNKKISFRLPVHMYDFISPKLLLAIKETIKKRNIDILWASQIYAAHYSKLSFPMKIIDTHNVVSDLYYNHVKLERNPLRKLYQFFEFVKMKIYEPKILNNFDYCIAVSNLEANKLKKHLRKTVVIPNFIDLSDYNLKRKPEKSLIFAGTFEYAPNLDAVNYFYDTIWPILKNKIKAIKWYIIGDSALSKLKKLSSDPNIIIKDFVDNLKPFLPKAGIYIIPLRAGSGTRFKILEAWASKIPVVSTSIGAEGLNYKNLSNILIADDPKTFSNKVEILINNKNISSALSSKGYISVKNNNSLKTVEDKLTKFISSL